MYTQWRHWVLHPSNHAHLPHPYAGSSMLLRKTHLKDVWHEYAQNHTPRANARRTADL